MTASRHTDRSAPQCPHPGTSRGRAPLSWPAKLPGHSVASAARPQTLGASLGAGERARMDGTGQVGGGRNPMHARLRCPPAAHIVASGPAFRGPDDGAVRMFSRGTALARRAGTARQPAGGRQNSRRLRGRRREREPVRARAGEHERSIVVGRGPHTLDVPDQVEPRCRPAVRGLAGVLSPRSGSGPPVGPRSPEADRSPGACLRRRGRGAAHSAITAGGPNPRATTTSNRPRRAASRPAASARRPDDPPAPRGRGL